MSRGRDFIQKILLLRQRVLKLSAVDRGRTLYLEEMAMKMLFIIYSLEIDEAIVTAFKRSGMGGYTKVKEVCGEGRETEPKLGSHIWPGKNNALFVVVEDNETQKAKELVRQLKKEHPRSGLRAFQLPLEDCV
ncbi:MAG: hypothetical protein HY742_00385 [Deltaproteobacteria bacterium]|nr:hypothetical protein [Deltaproteobacteria bacterium]